MFLLPFLSLFPYSPYDNKRLIELIIVSVALVFAIFAKLRLTANSHVAGLLLLFISLGGFSALNSSSPPYAFAEIANLTSLFVLAIVIAVLGQNNIQVNVKLFSIALLLSNMLYVVAVLSAYLAGLLNGIQMLWYNFFPGYSNPRFFNQFQIWTFPFLTYGYIYLRSNIKPIYAFIVALIISLWWMLLILSASRGAVIALLAAAILTMALYRSYAKRLLIQSLLFLMVGSLLYLGLFELVNSVKDTAPDYALSAIARSDANTRLILWNTAMDQIKGSPLIGIGPMHYALNDPLWGMSSAGSTWLPLTTAAHPHSSVLQITAEWGLPAAISLMSLSVYVLWRWVVLFNYKSMHREKLENDPQPIVIFWSMLSGSIYSLVSGVIVMPQSQLMAVCVFGLALATYSKSAKICFKAERRGGSNFVALLLLILLWCSVVSTSANLNYLPAGETVIQTLAPRFWFVGGIPHN